MSDSSGSENRPEWVDSHAHLTMFEPDEVEDVVDRAVAAGVGRVLVPATDAGDLDRAVELAEVLPGRVVAAVGVHPHEAASLDPPLRRRLESALSRSGVVAMGEIGLDYHYMSSPREDQLAALRWQLRLAVESEMPVILHNRESWPDLITLLEEVGSELCGVCHSFAEPPEAAARVRALGLHAGISGMVTFRRGDNVREMVRSLPADRILIETDSPFLAPEPHRGRRNEPAYVVHVGREVAKQLDLDLDSLARQTTANFDRLFGALS